MACIGCRAAKERMWKAMCKKKIEEKVKEIDDLLMLQKILAHIEKKIKNKEEKETK